MKARVKATEEMVEIIETDFVASNGMIYDEEDLIITKDEPDYWEKLKHQYAGMALQGILSNKELFNTITDGAWPPNKYVYIAERCDKYATALVNRLKEDKL